MDLLTSALLADLAKTKLNDSSVSDAEIDLAVEEIMTVISDYCRLDILKIPLKLKFTAANMVVDLIKSQNLDKLDLESGVESNIGIGCVSSVKAGDTEIRFSKNGNGTGAHVVDVDSVIKNYKAQLNRYRRITW